MPSQPRSQVTLVTAAASSTCESLKHEKYLYLAQAGPYLDRATAPRTPAERLEGLVSQEHAKWVSAREEAAAPTGRS